MLGVKTHTAMKTSADEAYYSRTALSYITEKLRHVDASGCAEIGTFSGESALILHESYDNTDYTTTIYLRDGKICELFCEAGLDLSPEAGSPVIEAKALSFKAENGLVTISYTDPDGRQSEASAALRSGGAVR